MLLIWYSFLECIELKKKASAIARYLEETVHIQEDEEVYAQSKTTVGVIEPANEVHTIYDEYSGYGYVVDKAFKPAVENKTFEGAISIEPQDGMFLFRANSEYYGQMMYFYGFELGEDEYWDKAGLCLVYSKEYVGTKEEEKLMHILDEAAKTFGKEMFKNEQ